MRTASPQHLCFESSLKDEPGFARVATLAEIRTKEGSLSIPLYVESSAVNGAHDVKQNGSWEAPLSDGVGRTRKYSCSSS